ncbi:hypothetical protein AXK11_05615 [Cephaloticoccus primus]|uniref:PEP-CTERM protein-sorting domain-containing protein n=1 Tax=Cephaloticoccus primus TaxID=1548207 RepID=A0A139SMK1_9BACT|nr:hypothetical protein [Cephaloticoccus primus]KXU35818.1 hypothetical protein AXK11_05615 [Cephaloticoccus primus]
MNVNAKPAQRDSRGDFRPLSTDSTFSIGSPRARISTCGLFLALGIGLGLPGAARAQLLIIPPGVYQWDGGAGTQSWGDAANWSHANAANDNQVPPSDAAAFFDALSSFGADPDAREEISVLGDTSIGSLWFGAHNNGPAYTLSSTGKLTLGEGVANQGNLIGVVDWYRSRETRIFAPTISLHNSAPNTVRISNQSMAGLLIGGGPGDSSSTFDLGSHTLQIRGGSMTHIASSLTGTGRIDVETGRTQLILNADNSGWTDGSLNIAGHAIAVIKHSGALGENITVNEHSRSSLPGWDHGTLMLRPTITADGEGLSGLTVSPKEIFVYSQGAGRATNINPNSGNYGKIGSGTGGLYNDGGNNTITSDIKGGGGSIGGNYFYSRSGNLKLTGRIRLDGNFTKEGWGTITLTRGLNPNFGYEAPDSGNTWSVGIFLNKGELRIEETHWALFGGFGTSYLSPTGSYIPLDNMSPTLYFTGGVLGLGVDTHFNRKVGDGIGARFGGSYNGNSTTIIEAANVYWGGRGGFIARGGIRTVELTLDKGGYIPDPNDSTKLVKNWELGGTLNWHKGGFMGAWEGRAVFGGSNTNRKLGGPLVLGSDSYENYLIWKNPIYFGNRNQFQSELDVFQTDAGLSYSFYAPGRAIEVQEGVAEMQGKLSGEGFDLVKRGKGLLRLTSTESNYERQFYAKDNVYQGGHTIIEAGALQGATNNLDFSNVILSDGVYMPNTANLTSVPGLGRLFNVTLGTGTGQFRWMASTGTGGVSISRGGGFAAGEQDTVIRIGTSTTALNWGTGGTQHFLTSGAELILGHYLSGATLTWDKALTLKGNDIQTLRVIRGRKNIDFDAVLTQKITATEGLNAGLRIVGDIYDKGTYDINEDMHNGRVALRNGDNELNNLIISGASATLDRAGKISGATHVLVDQGGTLTLDNRSQSVANRLATNSTLELDAGNFRYLKRTSGSDVAGANTLGTLKLSGGANTISTDSVLNFGGLERVNERTTLNLGGEGGFLPGSGPILAFSGSSATYLEWLTVGGTDWAVGNGSGQWSRMTGYTSNLNGGATSHARIANNNATVSQNRSIRSLALAGTGSVTINSGRTLTVGSGGLLFTSSNALSTPSILGSGSLATSGGNAFYAHVFSPVANVSATFTGGKDLVKTGSGTLSLTGGGMHSFNDVYVHEGRLELNLGSSGRFNASGKIYVGDRSGTDVLRLPQFDNQINRNAHVVLRGGDYGAGVLEFALKPAGLPGTTAFEGTTHRIGTLEVQGFGVIDFRGGEVGHANYLYIDELIIEFGSKLAVRNWFEGEDFLLVHRSKADEYTYAASNPMDVGIIGNSHQRIYFEGYEGVLLFLNHYDEDYYEITPFPRAKATYLPEPSTYGALLGTLGLGLFFYRQKRRKKSRPSQ